MNARPFYEMTYHRKDWRLSDAFKPQPGWGVRRFTVSLSALAEHTQEEMIACAKEASPDDKYRLTRLTLHPVEGGERVIFWIAADSRFESASPAPAGDSTNTGETAS